ncbi:MAG: patatin-like phospholipase family protein, partial [Lutibacter sp.]|nr:patatin-like phospholipase family protein [Lutibacter sp.]
MIKRLLCIGLFFVQILYGQEPLPDKDLKVGLVLSGGGAKGLAHIAVLKELEKAGVRIDYIGGTSMGAIVGSLYASGYGADQLDSIFRTIDFYKLLTDELPRKAKPFYEKEVGEKYVLTLPIKNEKVGIPVAVSEGQNGLNLHTRLTQHVSNISDFSKLPIPFLCVATDLETGKQVVLTEGFLPMAVKASASFPTLLSPVEIDGKLLSDGGIVNNFPVEEVREMGADLIIGVDIQGTLYEKSSLDSAVKILNQVVGFQLYQTLDYKYDLVDVLIQPAMDSYHVVSFDKIDEIMEAGTLAAQAKQDLLKSVASRQHSPSPRTIDPTRVPKFRINEVAIAGIENYTRPYILGKMNLRTRDSISYQKLIASIESLYGTGNFESVQYRIADKAGGNVLQMKLKERAVTSFFQLGLHYDDLYKTGILLNGLSKHLLLKNDVVSADLVLGDNVRYQFNNFIDNCFRWS